MLTLAPIRARAEEDPRRAQIEAATADAVASLKREVLATRVGERTTTAELVDRLKTQARFDELLSTARRVGGPRWLDQQTVQVRVELGGADIAAVLQKMAEQNTRVLPMRLHILRDWLRHDIARRTFSATGVATSSPAIDQLRPDPRQAAWRGVDDATRRAAVDAARQNAVNRIMDSLGAIDYDAGRHMADVLSKPAVSRAMTDWLVARPISSIEFGDDLQVRLTLAASPQDLWPVLQQAMSRDAAALAPRTPAGWKALAEAVQDRLVRPSGTALAKPVGPPRVVVLIPRDPPAWAVDRAPQVEAGVSPPVGDSKLRAARAAEAIAVAKLREHLNSLPLNSKTTLGEAAKIDRDFAAALDRAAAQAKIAKVDYNQPHAGWVTIQMALDLQTVWRMLQPR